MHMTQHMAKGRRAHPPRTYTERIDRRLRVALPADMGWRVGMRVYFHLTKDGAIQIGKVPTQLWQGRLLSARIQGIHRPLGGRKDRAGKAIRALRP